MMMVCRLGLFVGMSYLNYVTVPLFMPAYVTFYCNTNQDFQGATWLNPYKHRNSLTSLLPELPYHHT